MKIAFIVDAWFPFVGGGQIYAKELKKVLEEQHKCSVTIFYPPHNHFLVRACWSLVGWVYIVFKHTKVEFDLFHSQGYASGYVGKICSAFTGKPVVHTVHGSNSLDMDFSNKSFFSRQLKRLKKSLESWLLLSIDYTALITVSQKFLEYKNNSKETHFIPNGVDYSLFDSVKITKTKKPSLIWIGRDDPVKDKATLDQVITKVRQHLPDLQAEIILDGKLKPRQLIKRYKRSWVYIQTSRSEGFSLTVLEAMAAGLPVVATAVGENPHLISNGKNGYLEEVGDPQRLADQVIKLLRDSGLRNKMGSMNKIIVKENYSWNRVAAETHQVYSGLVKSKK